MLTMKAQFSLSNAEKYFREHLRGGDYYMEGRSVSGEWYGKGAEKLGLSGVTAEREFLRLCRNLHPQTGERLTQRFNSKRRTVDGDGNTHERANRRAFYDFTLSPPKSVSITALVADDRRIIEAHDTAVRTALEELQPYAATQPSKRQRTHSNGTSPSRAGAKASRFSRPTKSSFVKTSLAPVAAFGSGHCQAREFRSPAGENLETRSRLLNFSSTRRSFRSL